MIRSRRPLLLALVIAVAAGGAWLLWTVYRAPDRTDLATYWQLVVAVVALLVALVPLVSATRSRAAAEGADLEDEVLGRLAEAVGAQWRDAAAERGLRHPEPVAVQWSVDPKLGGPVAAAVDSAVFLPVPGYDRVGVSRLERGGVVRDLHAVLAGLGSGRLVIAGAPGSGKTAAAVLLVLDSLAPPQAEDASSPMDGGVSWSAGRKPHRRSDVPVLFPVAGWDPCTQELRKWVVQQLRTTYDQLFVGRRGAHLARKLLKTGRITLVLDGLDEIPASRRLQAVEKLNALSTTRLVVTGRREELHATLSRQILNGAVAVSLEPVTAEDTVAYLESSQVANRSGPRAVVCDLLRAEPTGPLAKALDTPLMISLVREIQDDRAVAELLRPGEVRPDSFAGLMEDRLLDRFVDSVYPEAGPEVRYDLRTVHRTLRWLAERSTDDGKPDELAWWRIPAWAPRAPRTVVVGAVTAVAMFGLDVSGFTRNAGDLARWLAFLAAIGAVLGASVVRWEGTPPLRWTTALRRPGPALTYGFAFGCLTLTGLAVTVPVEVSAVLVGLCVVGGTVLMASWVRRPRDRPRRPPPVAMILFGLAAGWVAMNYLFGRVLGGRAILPTLVVISLSGVVVALRLGLASSARPDQASPMQPLESWRRGRATELAGWWLLAVSGGVLTLVGGVLLAEVFPSVGLLAFGLAVLCGAALGLVFPASALTALACVQLALRHRLPVNLMLFLEDARKRGVLRAVGPAYEFRHSRLRQRLVRDEVTEPSPRTPAEEAVLGWLHDKHGSGDEHCRLAWWRIPTFTSPVPAVLVVGSVVGSAAWLGLGLLARPLWSSEYGTYVAVATAVGAGAGVLRLRTKLAAPEARPRSWASILTRPVAIGVVVGLAFAIDLHAIPGNLVVMLPIGLIAGTALWLLVGLVVGASRQSAAGARWRAITGGLPWGLRLLLGVNVGYAALILLLVAAPSAVETALYVVISLITLVTGLRLGLDPAVPCGSGRPGTSGEETDPFICWGRRRAVQLIGWLVAGAVVTGLVVRSAVRALFALPAIGSWPFVSFGIVMALALTCGVVLGLTAPATWLTSLAAVQLRVSERSPVRLMATLERLRNRREVRANDVWITTDPPPARNDEPAPQ